MNDLRLKLLIAGFAVGYAASVVERSKRNS